MKIFVGESDCTWLRCPGCHHWTQAHVEDTGATI